MIAEYVTWWDLGYMIYIGGVISIIITKETPSPLITIIFTLVLSVAAYFVWPILIGYTLGRSIIEITGESK